jgi:short-subunit dehydrogenase
VSKSNCIQVDVSDPDSVARLKDFKEPISLLVNNAGIFKKDSLGDLTIESLTEQFEVNTAGAVLVTQALMDNLGQGSKVVNISSDLGSIHDTGTGALVPRSGPVIMAI